MSRLPLSVIKEIGQRYAKRAKEMAGLYNIDIDGIGAIISTLDELEESKQKELLETMLQNDLDKGQIVEQRFIGFFNLHKMDGQVIQNAMMDIETQDILNALFGADQEIIDTLLNARPPEKDMIRSELESGKQFPIKSALPQEKSFLTKFESLRNKLLVLLFQATVVWSQRVYDFDKSIERLTHGFAEDFSQLIIPGNRVYVMSTEYNSDVDAYVADKIREGITLGVKESKYNLVYQPFFKDHVVRKVYSSDTSFKYSTPRF